MITAGPTYEAIDPVRFVGNHSSGKMGVAIAEEFAGRGADVTLVLGPSSIRPPLGIDVIRVKSAAEMYDACIHAFPNCDIAVMSAAVADYAPVQTATEKIKKADGEISLTLTKTKDILKALGKEKTNRQIVVGFALETNNEETYALKKLQEKNADMIVLNSMQDAGAGFGTDTNKITIFDKKGNKKEFVLKPKQEVAADIVNAIKEYTHA